MSFGTFNLFGFFQQPGPTGQLFPTNLTVAQQQLVINGGNAQANTSSDFNWFFPYAGELVPIEVIEGGKGAFPIKILSDSDVGTRHAIASVGVSGNLYGDTSSFNLGVAFSGNAFPNNPDLFGLVVTISGQISGIKPDNYSNFVILSGSFSGAYFDLENISSIVSGSVNDAHADYSLNKTQVSGNFVSGDISYPLVSVTVSGSFFPVKNDYSSIDYLLSGWSVGTNYIFTGISLQDNTNNITYFLDSYTAG